MQLIRSGSLNGPALQVGLEKVCSGMKQIVSLINDLLFVQEMELIKPAMRAVNVADVLVTIAHEAQERAAVNHLTILIDAPDALPTIEADPDGLLRALRALLDNAIKFSPGGGEIHVNATASDNVLEIAVADPGIGIEPDFMPRIFDRYQREEKRGNYLFGGIGLGLAIAIHLIESFGGSIDVQSAVGEGSVFTVRLPILTERTEKTSPTNKKNN